MKIKSILYVEDEDSIREQLSGFIQRFCDTLIVAENGEIGFRLFKKHAPSIVISDIKMPKMDGLDMVRKIKKIAPKTSVILTSAHSESEYYMQAIDLQVEGYMLKPIELKKLSTKLNEIIDTQVEQLNSILQQDALKIMAFKDALTGISNRQMFDEDLDKEVKRFQREKKPLSIIMFDIDHFKTFNDKYGHQVGDMILVELTKLISQNIRQTDLFARWGGEEFMILLPNSDLKAAKKLAEFLRVKVQECCFEGALKTTVSFGVATFKEGESIKSFTKRVDDALYEAKEGGRNQVKCAL